MAFIFKVHKEFYWQHSPLLHHHAKRKQALPELQLFNLVKPAISIRSCGVTKIRNSCMKQL